nr:MAG TPA: hypothetical protein [Bacteriophage sp.]
MKGSLSCKAGSSIINSGVSFRTHPERVSGSG